MAKHRILIAGGCSFTQYPNQEYNWPYFLSKELEYSTYYLGTGASDNSLIANKVLNQLQFIKKSQQYKSKDIIVGVMWSGMSRSCVYLQQPPLSFTKIEGADEPNELNQHVGSPNRVTHLKNYYLLQSHFQDGLSQNYYKHFYDDVGAAINTIKNMLLVQNYCKLNNIAYFFSEYSHDTITNLDIKDHIDVKFFYDMIDFEQFLPIKHMFDWCLNESGLKHRYKDDHPTSSQSLKFVDNIVIPFLKNKGYA